MGGGLSFWIFLFSLFPNPIVEDGKVGFINNNGESFVPPNYYSFLFREPLTIENFIEINKRTISNTISNSYAFPRSEGGKVGYITQDVDSLIIRGKNGHLFDSFSLSEDTLQFYYYLDRENSARTKIKSFVDRQTAIAIDSSDKKTIKIGLKDTNGSIITPFFHQVKGLREYFSFINFTKKVKLLGDKLILADKKIIDFKGNIIKEIVDDDNVKLLGDQLIFTGENIIDFKGNIIHEANSVQFSENQQYIICSNQEQQTLINLEGDIIINSKLKTLGTVNPRAFAWKKNKNHPLLIMTIDKDTLFDNIKGMRNLQPYYGLEDKYEFHNFDIVPIFTVKMSEKLGSGYGLFINNEEELIQLPKKPDSLYPIPLQNPQSDFCIIKYVSSKNFQNVKEEGVVNKKGKFVFNPRKDVSISPVSGHWIHVHEKSNDSLGYFLNIVNGEKILETNVNKSYHERSDPEKFYFNIKWKSYKLIQTSNEKYILDYDSFSDPANNVYAYKNLDIYKLSGEEMEYIDSRSSIVIPENYRSNIFVIEQKEKHFLYNLNNSKIVSEGFDDLSVGSLSGFDEESHLFIATKKGKKGVINQEGKWVIKPIYHEIVPFRGELALAQMDSTSFQYINRSGETVWKLPETDKTAWNKDAFLESFKNCEPSIYMQKQGYETVYEYEIKQSAAEGGGCVVESRFRVNKNIEWMGKTMTCTYDNSLPFKEAIQPCLPNGDENECDCEGELWDIMSRQK